MGQAALATGVMSHQDGSITPPRAAPESTRLHKAGRDRLADPRLEDFPTGRCFIAAYKWRNGHEAFALVEVIDGYQSKEFGVWPSHLHITVRVLMTQPDSRLAPLVGHLVRLDLDRGHAWWQHGLKPTTLEALP